MCDPLKPQKLDEELNHFAYLKPCASRYFNIKKYIYLGGGVSKDTAFSKLDSMIRKEYNNEKENVIDKPKPSSLNAFEIDVAHQLVMLREIPSPPKKKSTSLYSKLMKSHKSKRIDLPFKTN